MSLPLKKSRKQVATRLNPYKFWRIALVMRYPAKPCTLWARQEPARPLWWMLYLIVLRSVMVLRWLAILRSTIKLPWPKRSLVLMQPMWCRTTFSSNSLQWKRHWPLLRDLDSRFLRRSKISKSRVWFTTLVWKSAKIPSVAATSESWFRVVNVKEPQSVWSWLLIPRWSYWTSLPQASIHSWQSQFADFYKN